MSTEELKALTQRYVQEPWNNGNLSAVDELTGPDFLLHPNMNREGLKQAIADFRAAFPDLHFAIEEMIAEGDKVAYRWTATGTHRGAFQGIAPTGKPIRSTGITIIRFANGKIVEDRFEAGGKSIEEQLAADSASGGSSP